jgi:hypothetical protein
MALQLLTRDTKLLCGHCGKPLTGPSGWGIGWQELPFMLFGKLVYDGPGADIIKEGDVLVVPVCDRRCRRRYLKAAAGFGLEFNKRVFIPYKAMGIVPSMPSAMRLFPLE